jgi:hypothetical protein
MLRIITSLIAVIFFSGCSNGLREPVKSANHDDAANGENSSKADTTVPETAPEARRALHDQGNALGLFTGLPAEWSDRLINGEQWHVQRQSYSDALERIEGTLRENEKKNAIVFGMLDDLRKDGDCWRVEDLRGYHAMVAYLDANSGRLILLWRPPEG